MKRTLLSTLLLAQCAFAEVALRPPTAEIVQIALASVQKALPKCDPNAMQFRSLRYRDGLDPFTDARQETIEVEFWIAPATARLQTNDLKTVDYELISVSLNPDGTTRSVSGPDPRTARQDSRGSSAGQRVQSKFIPNPMESSASRRGARSSIHFRSAPLPMLLQYYADVTGNTITVQPGLEASISFESVGKVDRQEAIHLIEAELTRQGYLLDHRDDTSIHISLK